MPDASQKMPFGKHEGKSISEITQQFPSYAKWAAEALDDRPDLAGAFESELKNVGVGQPASTWAARSTASPSPDEGQEVSGETVCGTCGEEIRGKVYFNAWGPAHLRCVPVA